LLQTCSQCFAGLFGVWIDPFFEVCPVLCRHFVGRELDRSRRWPAELPATRLWYITIYEVIRCFQLILCNSEKFGQLSRVYIMAIYPFQEFFPSPFSKCFLFDVGNIFVNRDFGFLFFFFLLNLQMPCEKFCY
jgi:hypothetical protein